MSLSGNKGKSKGKGKAKSATAAVPMLAQTIYLPLHFSNVQVYSGLTPPESLAQAAMKGRKQQTRTNPAAQQQQEQASSSAARPRPRLSQSTPTLPPRQQRHDPLYPPQLRPGELPAQAGVSGNGGGAVVAGSSSSVVSPSVGVGGGVFEDGPPPTYDEAPPSYDEAMAEVMEGPVVASEARPAYSGVTNENAPDTLAGKGS